MNNSKDESRIIIFKNKMYNLDVMTKQEIEELKEILEKEKTSIQTKLEALAE